MVAFLPPLYPDELLYSLLARIHWLTCSENPKYTLDDLFGCRNVRAGVALQANLTNLCAHCPPQRKLTPDKLMRDATLFPYLTAFQSSEVRDWALTKLSAGNAGAVHIRLGLVAGVVRLPKRLHYCPACASAMLSTLGELYWMRAHQLPGMLVCHLHRGVPLSLSTVHPAEANQHEYIAANETNCPLVPTLPVNIWSLQAIRLLNDIADVSVALMTNPPQAQPLEAWGDYYGAELRLRGFGKGTSNIDQMSLRTAYVAHFSPIFSVLPYAKPDVWLEGMARRHRKAVAPLHHILLRLLIDALPPLKPSNPFGYGPWPCRNPLADHCGQLVVSRCKTHKQHGIMIGVFDCSCGYSFSQSAVPESGIRILNQGSLFIDKLRELQTVGLGLRATARALAVDANTVRSYVSKLGLDSPWKARSQRSNMLTTNRESVRARWSSVYQNAPEMSRKQIRFEIPAEYAWLYRHDRAWMESQPPFPKQRQGGRPRRDWSAIDIEMSQNLRESAEQMRTEAPPRRITRAKLERLLGKPDWLASRLNKLPLSQLALIELTESVEAFQCRRITWAADELHRLDRPTTAWRLRRLAGLHDHCAPAVEEALSAAEERKS